MKNVIVDIGYCKPYTMELSEDVYVELLQIDDNDIERFLAKYGYYTAMPFSASLMVVHKQNCEIRIINRGISEDGIVSEVGKDR